MFVDSDDYISEVACETVAANISDSVDIIEFLFKRVYDDPEKNEVIEESDQIIRITGRKLFGNYINRTDFTHMVCDKAFRRSLFEGKRFIEGRLAEDMAICYRLIGEARSAVAVKRVLYFYYMRGNSIMGKGSLKLCLDAYKGECEAYAYGNEFYQEFKHDNDVRLLNQSMKTYLKLQNLHHDSVRKADLDIVTQNINRIDKKQLPMKTKIFYITFKISKPVAWKLFKIFKLSPFGTWLLESTPQKSENARLSIASAAVASSLRSYRFCSKYSRSMVSSG